MNHPTSPHYQGETGQQYYARFDVPAPAVGWVGRLRAAKLAREIGAEDVVLEYGVGAGWNLSAIRCKRRLGFDVVTHLVPRLQELGIEFVGDPASLPGGSVDVVVCHHVLEHVLAPAEALREMGRLLRGRGKLLLYVPFEKERRYRSFRPGEINHHLYSWNVQTLGNLVEELGFSVLSARVGEHGYDRFASVWASRLRIGETGFRLLRAAVHLVRPGREVRLVAQKPVVQPSAPPV